MNEKRFIVESVMIDCLCKDEPRIAKVITDTDENYSYEDLYEVAELLNEQQALINALKKENKELKEDLKKGFDVPIPYVENSMRRLRAEHKVGELQATIEQLEEEIERLNGLLFGTPKAIE